MINLRVAAAAAFSSFLLASCQSSNIAVSSFAGANLVGDRGDVVVSQRIDRERIGGGADRTRRVRRSAPTDTTALTTGKRTEPQSIFSISAFRPAPVRTSRKSRSTLAARNRGFVNSAVFSSTDRDKTGFLFAALPANEAVRSSDKGVSRAAPVRKKRKASKKRRATKMSLRRSKATRKRGAKRSAKRGSRGNYRKLIAKHARANGVPLKLAMAVVEVESNFRSKARGAAGEIGLMQIMPRTARYIGYRGKMKNLYNPDTNLRYGMKYLGKAYRLGGGSTCGAILKYNAGHGAKRMNPISRKYCARVARILRRG